MPNNDMNRGPAGRKSRRGDSSKREGRAKKALGSNPGRGNKSGYLRPITYFGIIVGVSAVLAVFLWFAASDVFALGKEEKTAVVVIQEDDSLADIATTLKKAGIIESKTLFELFGLVAHASSKVDAGTYELTTDLDYRALVSAMQDTSSKRATVKVTIPEGYDEKQIFELLDSKGVCDYDELEDAAANAAFNYSFLEGVETGEAARLEGYLFPDTYEFYINESANSAINKMLSNFNKKLTAEYRERAESMGYSLEEIITIASLIEKEAANDDERAEIASVIYNRLDSSSYPYLQIDATIQYILPERKEKLTNDDLAIESAYNTYLYKGLPPGPIASPGIASIKAALYPESTNYYFYALGSDGVHHFFKTYQEHLNFLNSLAS